MASPKNPSSAKPARDLKAMSSMIAAKRDELPKRLVQVADFCMAHPQEVAFGTVVEIAKHAQVQPSTLVRFAHALGYAGFTDMQDVFRSHARKRWPDYPQRMESVRSADEGHRDPMALLKSFARASVESLEQVGYSINAASLKQAVDILARSQIIYLLAARRSFPVTSYLGYAMRRLKVRCELVDQIAGLAPEQIALLSERDVLLIVSFAPYAESTRQLTEAAQKGGVPIVAITDSPFSPLVQAAACWLEISEADFGGFRSLAGTFALAMTLAVAVARQREDRKS
jgi:DNA-binding MurR/RpiR family transcriptional regulator